MAAHTPTHLEARQVDDHRRVVLPQAVPKGAAVTVQQIDEDTFIVRRQRPRKSLFVVLDPDIKELPEDPEWDKKALAMAEHSFKKLPRPKF
ncbi:MAG TPA: hypothetical protein VH280_14805 [Verrucomicrobiae bacterium]|jgi:hypothetical protein|nr:hypothetical protein [Verrucomicrobiae bacterium]